jgi:fatty acid hydroxylase family protein
MSSSPRPSLALRRREEILESVSKSYRPELHLALTIGSGIVVLVLAALFAIDDLRAIELLVVPAMFVLANLGEWTTHKWILHRRVPGLTYLYEQHTPIHHSAYRYDAFAMKSWRELKLVLIPPFGVALISVVASPLGLLVALALSPNAGWLVIVTSAFYVVGYEIAHLVYHLPEHHPISRLPLVQKLREHHRRHHHPRVMQKWNFNVVIPIGDWLFGTWLSDERFAELTRKE